MKGGREGKKEWEVGVRHREKEGGREGEERRREGGREGGRPTIFLHNVLHPL